MGAWQSQARRTLHCFLLSFPLLFIVILWAYAIRPYFFSVSVGFEFIRPLLSFCRGQMYLTHPYCELDESRCNSFYNFVGAQWIVPFISFYNYWRESIFLFLSFTPGFPLSWEWQKGKLQRESFLLLNDNLYQNKYINDLTDFNIAARWASINQI